MTLWRTILTRFAEDLAIHAAGALKVDQNLPTLLRLAERGDCGTWRLASALTDYATEECRPYLKKWFEGDESKSTRVMAAWGLGKLGDKEAVAYLISMLDDPDLEGPTLLNPASPSGRLKRFATSMDGRSNGTNRTLRKLWRDWRRTTRSVCIKSKRNLTS